MYMYTDEHVYIIYAVKLEVFIYIMRVQFDLRIYV